MTIFQAYKDLANQLSSLYENREAGNIADWVMEKLTGWQKIDRLLHRENQLTAAQEAQLQQFTSELLNHRPVQYVLGECWFAGGNFLVNEQVLIPRPETEELVAWISEELREAGKAKTILDIGTGSGCIAIRLKANCPEIISYGVDISREALDLATINAQRNNVDVQFIQCDILNRKEREKLSPVDLIVSNPPYIPHKDKAEMQSHVLKFEPPIALFVANEDPLLFYREIIDFALERLTGGGSLFFEIHEKQGEPVVGLLKSKGFESIRLQKDLYGKNRMVKAVLPIARSYQPQAPSGHPVPGQPA